MTRTRVALRFFGNRTQIQNVFAQLRVEEAEMLEAGPGQDHTHLWKLESRLQPEAALEGHLWDLVCRLDKRDAVVRDLAATLGRPSIYCTVTAERGAADSTYATNLSCEVLQAVADLDADLRLYLVAL